MAYQHLEELAKKYALAAVTADRAGKKDVAIKNYKKAVEILNKILKLYPDCPFRSLYSQMIKEYEARIKQLEAQRQPTLAVSASEETDVEDFILKEKPDVRFEDIADLEEAKQAIKEAIIYPVKRPDLFPLGWPRGILLFGPPGCGKTMLAAAVATEIDAVFFHVDAANIMSKWLGEAEKNVAKLFQKAREVASKGKPAIIFIDEIDALLGTFTAEVGGEVRVRNQFLKEMDGLQDKKFKLHVYVIGATNKPWKLDEAFIRRFQKRIYVPLPDFNARLQLFKLYTRNIELADDVDLYKLARITEGYTGSDIRDIVQAAHMRVVRELFERGDYHGKPRPVSMEDFLAVIERRKPSVNPDMIRAYEKWYEQFKAL